MSKETPSVSYTFQKLAFAGDIALGWRTLVLEVKSSGLQTNKKKVIAGQVVLAHVHL